MNACGGRPGHSSWGNIPHVQLPECRAAKALTQKCPLQSLPVAAHGTQGTMQAPPVHGRRPCVIPCLSPQAHPLTSPAHWRKSGPAPGPLHWLLLPGGW